MKYDKTYKTVVLMAKVKMEMNSHKGNIEDIGLQELIDMAMEELGELKGAIREGNQVHIIEEAADVLNYVVAASHAAIKSYRTRK